MERMLTSTTTNISLLATDRPNKDQKLGHILIHGVEWSHGVEPWSGVFFFVAVFY